MSAEGQDRTAATKHRGSCRTFYREGICTCTPCDGSSECVAELHIHGCFADKGKCDEPAEHGDVPAATVHP